MGPNTSCLQGILTCTLIMIASVMQKSKLSKESHALLARHSPICVVPSGSVSRPPGPQWLARLARAHPSTRNAQMRTNWLLAAMGNGRPSSQTKPSIEQDLQRPRVLLLLLRSTTTASINPNRWRAAALASGGGAASSWLFAAQHEAGERGP